MPAAPDPMQMQMQMQMFLSCIFICVINKSID